MTLKKTGAGLADSLSTNSLSNVGVGRWGSDDLPEGHRGSERHRRNERRAERVARLVSVAGAGRTSDVSATHASSHRARSVGLR